MTLLFPASEEPKDEVAPAGGVGEAPTVGEAITVLVVDDEEAVRTVTAMMLEAEGFSALTAADGPSAIGLLKENVDEIDIVLVDIMMPGMGGADTLNELRRIREDLPVVVVSGYSEGEVETSFDGHHVDRFLQKPYGPDELGAMIRQLVAEKARSVSLSPRRH